MPLLRPVGVCAYQQQRDVYVTKLSSFTRDVTPTFSMQQNQDSRARERAAQSRKAEAQGNCLAEKAGRARPTMLIANSERAAVRAFQYPDGTHV